MLRGSGIVFKRNTRTILDEVNFEARAGEFIGIVGKNGEGKTTLLNILAGLEKPLTGQVNYGEYDLKSISLRELRKYRAVLPQNFSINFEMTVYDFLLLSRRVKGKINKEDFDTLDEIIDRFSLESFLEKSILRLSGGELQRVLFAKTLLQISPLSKEYSSFLFLDEPTSALDLEVQQKILETLKNLTREHKVGVIAILHDINQASMYCDKLCVLAEKRIAIYDAPSKVVTKENIERYFKVKANIIYSDDNPFLIF